MRITVLTILLLAAFHPMISTNTLEELPVPSFSGSDGVELIMESEPNDSNTTGQEVYPGDVVRGTVDMWSDQTRLVFCLVGTRSNTSLNAVTRFWRWCLHVCLG